MKRLSPAQILGAKGGKAGGGKWLKSLTPEQRRAHGQKAALARWRKAGRGRCKCGVLITKGKEDRSNCFTCNWIKNWEQRLKALDAERRERKRREPWTQGAKTMKQIKKLLTKKGGTNV